MLGFLDGDDGDKIKELEEKVNELREDKEKLKRRYESEKKRRSDLSREKQEAEEEMNRMKDKIRNLESGEDNQVGEDKKKDFSQVEMEEFLSIIRKMEDIESDDRELFTVYIGEGTDFIGRNHQLKKSLDASIYGFLNSLEDCILFSDGKYFNHVVKMKSFFEGEWFLGKNFNTDPIRELIGEEKYFVVIGHGDTEIYREEEGDLELIEKISTRVERSHSKGGFSQKRFERKRKGQIKNHLEEVREAVPDKNTYLLGDRRLCKEVEGKYIGGFNDNKELPEAFYGFRVLRPGWF